MPDDLERYFLDQHPVEKAVLDELRSLTSEVLRTLVGSFLREPGTWPYQLENAKPVDFPKRPSMSTTAMISFALGLATGAIRQSSLAPSIGDPLGSEKLRSVVRRFNGRAMDCIAALADDVAKAVDKRVEAGFPKPESDPPKTESATFGSDDPFTLTWLLEILASDDDPSRAAFTNELRSHAEALITRVAADPEAAVLQIRPGESVTHAFPLLRVLQLADTIARVRGVDVPAVADLAAAREYLLRRVHLQLSESHIADGSFDAADLVFSAEGWMLTSPFEPDLAIVDEVFRVLQAGQERTPYWRPLRPFKATPQGLILLPQSVEIANSLLRICSFPALDAREYFSRHLDLLQRYTQWLQGRVFRGQTAGPGACAFTGWESEHTYAQNRIHLWQTSQVLIFLHHYAAMLQQHIARKLLRLAPLVPREHAAARAPQAPSAVQAWQAWKEGEPLLLSDERSRYRVYQRIEDEFIAPRVRSDADEEFVSMLLYGPPGTGKSRLAKELANALGFPLLTVTPSDFLTAGGEAVEARAKALFQVLAEQRDMIVLFDEIDNLLLDRDSDLYHGQGDVFKLLTPGMLTKLNDLAKEKRVIFVIATNYYERIDPAIKRPGRIDARYLVLPPDLSQRRAFLVKELTGVDGEELEQASRSTVRFTYRELTDLVRHVHQRLKDDSSVGVAEAVHRRVQEVAPLITLESYSRRVGLKWSAADSRAELRDDVFTVEKPWEELALLTYLECQAGGWPGDPLWLPDAAKEALKQGAVRDAEVVELLRTGMLAARGDHFLDDLSETSL